MCVIILVSGPIKKKSICAEKLVPQLFNFFARAFYERIINTSMRSNNLDTSEHFQASKY